MLDNWTEDIESHQSRIGKINSAITTAAIMIASIFKRCFFNFPVSCEHGLFQLSLMIYIEFGAAAIGSPNDRASFPMNAMVRIFF